MRELKFRGYNGAKWLYGSEISGIPCFGEVHYFMPNYDNELSPNYIGNWDSVSCLGRYTGLKDKNDKEIYEGDLVKINGKLYMIKYEIGSMMLVRCFINTDMYEEFKNCWNDDVYPISQYYWENDCEEGILTDCIVIGNIFENKELLEGDKNE